MGRPTASSMFTAIVAAALTLGTTGCAQVVLGVLLATDDGGGGSGGSFGPSGPSFTPAPPAPPGPPSPPTPPPPSTSQSAPPTVTGISPADGPIAGGTAVTITGTNFVPGATSVRVGDAALVSVAVNSSTSISGVTSVTVQVGAADVVVNTPGGSGALSGFTYRLGLAQDGPPYAVATDPHDLIASDLDGDGDLDLALSHRTGSLTRLANDGTGAFTTGTLITVAGRNLFGLAIADLDGDGVRDIVATAIDSNELVLLRGGPGGSFTLASPVITGVSAIPELLALGDLNEDGALDAAIPLFGSPLGTTPSTVRVYLGNGAGHFATSGASLAVENGPQVAKVLDLDGDGDLDIACTNLHSGGMGFLRGNGDGTFDPHQLVATGFDGRGLAVADFDRDGREDVLVTNELTPPVLVRFDGSGLTTTPLTTSQPGHFRGVAVDVNRDGWPDLAAEVFGEARCSVWVNDSAGGFVEHLLTLPAAGPGNWSGMAAGDFDGDGRPDLAVVGNAQSQVTVFLNR